MTDKPTHVINNKCIDLIFCTNQSEFSNHELDVSILCYLSNVIRILFMVKLTYVCLSLQYISENLGLWKASTENSKKAISNFDWNKAIENLSMGEKVDLLNKPSLNIFINYIANKKIKCGYRQLYRHTL